jgi:hypothetical protein
MYLYLCIYSAYITICTTLLNSIARSCLVRKRVKVGDQAGSGSGLVLGLGLGLWLTSFVTPFFNFNTAINCEGFSTFSANVSMCSRSGLEVRVRVRVRIRARFMAGARVGVDFFRELLDDVVDRSRGVVVN